jgi:hypothetical protein
LKKKDEVVPVVSETSEEEEDEEEEEIEIEETDSEYELTESAQQLEKPTKRVTKKVSKSEPLKKPKIEKTETKTETTRKRKLNLDSKDQSQSKKTKKGVKEYPSFTNSDCDSDYTGDGIKNLTYHKAKITGTINMICHVFDGSKIKNYQGSEFAAITFQKKTKDDKSYELTIPLERGFNIIRAIDRFAELNPTIFKDLHRPACYKCKNKN